MQFSAADGGMSLKATWDESDIQTVNFWVDNRTEMTVPGNAMSYTITQPGRMVSWSGVDWPANSLEDERELDSASFAPIVTSTITLYPMSDSLDPTHKYHALAFLSEGYGRASAYNDDYHSATFFVLVDSGDSLFLVSTGDYNYPGLMPYHYPGGQICPVTSDFGGLRTCPDSTAAWSGRTRLELNKTYAMDITPRFAKVRVEAIQGKAVTLKTAVQWCWGLRWVVTN
jgi:hypothetical protein